MSEGNATICLPIQTKERLIMTNRICTLKVVIDNTPYYYEAHSYQRVAEILSAQLETLKINNAYLNKNFQIDEFEVLFFQEVE